MVVKKMITKKFRMEKILKRRIDKLRVKWKEYDNSINCWIDQKDFV